MLLLKSADFVQNFTLRNIIIVSNCFDPDKDSKLFAKVRPNKKDSKLFSKVRPNKKINVFFFC